MKSGDAICTIAFTAQERQRIEKAAKECGWNVNEGAAFGRHVVLNNVRDILRAQRSAAKSRGQQ